MRHALIENCVVVDVILWDGETDLPGLGTPVPCPENVSVGWTCSDGQWGPAEEEPTTTPDPTPDPAKDEAKAALLAALPEGAITQEQLDTLFGPSSPTASS